MTDNENILILKELKDNISKLAVDTLYNFHEMTHQEKYRWYDDMITITSKDPTITTEINHTKFPDDAILILLENNGLSLNNINDLASIDMEPVNDDICIGYKFKIAFPVPVTSTIIEINTNINIQKEDHV